MDEIIAAEEEFRSGLVGGHDPLTAKAVLERSRLGAAAQAKVATGLFAYHVPIDLFQFSTPRWRSSKQRRRRRATRAAACFGGVDAAGRGGPEEAWTGVLEVWRKRKRGR